MEELRRKCEQLGKEPRVWYRVPGYVVRNVTPDLVESVVHHMNAYFATEEIFWSVSKVCEDPVSLQENATVYRKFCKQNLTLIVLAEDSPGADLKPITAPNIPLAGVNLLVLECKDDPVGNLLPEGVSRRKVVEVIRPIFNMINVFNHYNVEVYMDAIGLSIHPDCRGRGLADAMLKARFELCRELGVKITKTVFTGIASQKVGLRCGFKVVKEILFKDIVTRNGELYFRDFPPLNKVLITVKEIDTA